MNPTEYAQREYAEAKRELRVAFHGALARRMGYFFPRIETARTISERVPQDEELFRMLTKRRQQVLPAGRNAMRAAIVRFMDWLR